MRNNLLKKERDPFFDSPTWGKIMWSILSQLKYSAILMITLTIAASFVIGFKITTSIREWIIFVSKFSIFAIVYILYDQTINKKTRRSRFTPYLVLISAYIAMYDYMPSVLHLSLYGTLFVQLLFQEETVTTLINSLVNSVLTLFLGALLIHLRAEKFVCRNKETAYTYLLHPIVLFTIYSGILISFGAKQALLGRMITFPIVVVSCVYISKYQLVQFIVDPINYIKNKKEKSNEQYSII